MGRLDARREDSFIYALVLASALTELLPRSDYAATLANVGLAGSILFALFLVGWGLSFIWGPLADRFGRTKVLAETIFTFAIFTGLAATAHTVWELGIYRFFAGVGIGREWALAGTYVAEAWPEDRRKMGASYLPTGYYAGFFLAAALNYTIGAAFGWRVMFLVGLFPVLVSILVLTRVKETDRWERAEAADPHIRHVKREPAQGDLQRAIPQAHDRRRRTADGRYHRSLGGRGIRAVAVIQLATKAGMGKAEAERMASIATGLLSIGTIVGCLALPPMAEKIGRRNTLAVYFLGMAASIALAFGWAFYLPNGLVPFIALLVVLGFFGGNFALFSLWLPEQFETRVRATAFAFCTSVGRFFGAIVNFGIGAMVLNMKTLGVPIVLTATAFLIGLAVIPLAPETKGHELPN